MGMPKNTFPNIQTQQSEPLDFQTAKIRDGHHSKRASNRTTNENQQQQNVNSFLKTIDFSKIQNIIASKAATDKNHVYI